MKITGNMLIGSAPVRGHAGELHAIDPSSGQTIAPTFGAGGKAEVDRACQLAALAFDAYRETSLEQRARFLESIAEGLVDLGPALIERAMAETGLLRARLEGERGRTVGQLRLFAKVVRDGRWLDVTIDKAMADLRLRKIAIGPVAVFGASNFPLAFSVAGGDTASALAAGCPVVVKAHPGHLGTSELVGRVIQAAVQACGLPEGVFSLLIGEGNEIGQTLVWHPAIQAVGFTGSRQGGLALSRVANARPQPIPVYAEMSSINPVFLFSGALADSPGKLAQAFVDSLVLGTGQFCTNPGLVIGIAGPHFEQFKAAAAVALAAKESTVMLTQGIHSAYCSGLQRLADAPNVRELARGKGKAATGGGESATRGTGDQGFAAQAALFWTEAHHLLDQPELEQEVFGPAGLLVACRDVAEMRAIAEHLEGQLTATLHLDASDHDDARQLLPVLERKAGRILVNGFPTGVEVSYAMVHGGPFPATSDGRSTSVGALSIERFLRPVCYQDMPPDLLPTALQDGNPLGLSRLIDGKREGA